MTSKKVATSDSDIPVVTATELKMLIGSLVKTNLIASEPVNLCIWGDAGIGKSHIVRSFEGTDLDGVPIGFAEIRTGEASEQGDIVGYPDKSNGTATMLKYSFIPNVPGPGIIHWDDINRGSSHVLNATMGIIQTNKSAYWEIPKGWTHIMTANPDNGQNDVTTLDTAKMTRTLHVELKFDIDEWVRWAEQNRVYGPIIAFAKHDEAKFYNQTERTCPRTWTALSNLLKVVDPEERNIAAIDEKIIRTYTCAAVGSTAANFFVSFLKENSEFLISPSLFFTDIEKAYSVIDLAIEKKYLAMVYVTYFRLASYVVSDYFQTTQTDTHISILCEILEKGVGEYQVRRDQIRAIVEMIIKGNPSAAIALSSKPKFIKLLA